MNIVNKLTLRQLKQNKRRTLVTIIGVIISAAMITAVSTISVSFLDLLKRDEIDRSGEWHVRYQNVNKEQIEAIQADKATKALVLSKDIGYAQLEGSSNRNKPYLFVKTYNSAGFQHFPIDLQEGRLPQAGNEVVISAEIAQTAKVAYRIGDTITLDIGSRKMINGETADVPARPLSQNDSLMLDLDNGVSEEKLEISETRSYTVVGVIERPDWEPTWSPGYTIIAYTDANLLSDQERVTASVVVNKVNKSIYSHAKQLAGEIGYNADVISYNSGLLRYYGVTNDDGLNMLLYSLSGIIMGIIMIGSVSLIYNSFAISVSERSRHLGMLSSVGATRRQKRNSVFFEGAVIGLISIPLGIIFGLIGIGITFWYSNSILQDAMNISQKLIVKVTPASILVAIAVSALTIFISTYIPARRASKVSAIDAIRQSMDIKLTGKAVKTSRLVRKLFGFEAEIGLKNLKRNKRRYQATVFSLVISILLFLTVSYFTDVLKKGLILSQDGVNFDIEVTIHDEELNTSFYNAIASIHEVESIQNTKSFALYSWIEEDDIADPLKKMAQNDEITIENGKFQYYVTIFALDDESLKSYAAQTGTDYEALLDPDGMKTIVVNETSYEESNKYVETRSIHKEIGDSLPLHSKDWDTKEETSGGQLEIAGLTAQQPIGAFKTSLSSLNVVVSIPVFERLQQLGNNAKQHVEHGIFIKSTDPMKTQRDIEEMSEVNELQEYRIWNVHQYRQQEEQMLLLMSVFTYGFILLITAISVANIFNTISTSIMLRKREFAMLKSVGMTPKGFNKMINYESIFYGIKSLLYGLPVSLLVMYLIYQSMMNSFSFSFELPWLSLLVVIVAVFLIVGVSMMYASSKAKRENIIDAIKQENI